MSRSLREAASAPEFTAAFSGDLLWNEPLSKHTYYRIGGPADLLAIPRSRKDLEALHGLVQATGVPFFVLGAGSNLLVSDKGFRGLVIRTHRMNTGIGQIPKGCITAGASVMVFSLLKRASEEGWGGLEFLTGIPGTLGGVVCMNGGTHLGEAKDALESIEAFDLATGTWRRISHDGFVFSYRHNGFLGPAEVVYETVWRYKAEPAAAVKGRIDETLARRKATQPIDKPSCGSVFKNPREAGLHAWQVIEKLGLRGHRFGEAQFSEKHPNFIINLGKATAADVRALIDLAKSRAASELGVKLEEEVKYLGF
ncbi:MAG TPA: UDP-N-acetylmuramate dehydrogenase [Bdellovibrionota bacterium]|jgi:UDP-N-acetylmuramate dehydrogenase|nr:UDP-N-acetylmuramate dehydrogenase [Bdellovibrionota bacterium]